MDTDGDAIKRKAYELWERRGRPLGSPEVDWGAAERLLRGARNTEDGEGGSGAEAVANDVRYGLREMNET